jgi:subtilase family serine protease
VANSLLSSAYSYDTNKVNGPFSLCCRLTPESFAARFGVADADIEPTENWLTNEGFHVDSVARSRDRITFTGTAAQVQRAFGAELHHYRVEGAVHFAPASDLTLPAESPRCQSRLVTNSLVTNSHITVIQGHDRG